VLAPFPFIKYFCRKDKEFRENPKQEENFISQFASNIVFDSKGRLCFAFNKEWDLKMAMGKNQNIAFYKT